nr:hypothetical protein [Tanacetum cinerariifolium]
KIAAQKAEIAILNAKTVGNKTSRTTKLVNPKVIALGMDAISPKYIAPQRRTNRETPIPLPKKKQVTFQETPKPSPRFTKKPVTPLLKKPNVNVPLKLSAKSAKGEKVEEYIRNLNKNNRVDSHVKCSVSVKNLNAVCGACHECLISSNHDNCLVYSVKSVSRKQPKAKNTVRTTKKVWRPKSKKASHPLKTDNTNVEDLSTLHMDLCGPMRTDSINKKKYMLVIVDDYIKFGWVRFLRTKDETPENWILMEAARTMLIFAKAPLFLWAEAVAIACYTLNRSLIHTLYGKTYYELLKGKKPDLKYFRVFSSLCYPTNDYDDVGKLKAKADIGCTSSDLVNDPPTPSVSTTVQQFDELFQPSIDEDEEFPPAPIAPINAPAV